MWKNVFVKFSYFAGHSPMLMSSKEVLSIRIFIILTVKTHEEPQTFGVVSDQRAAEGVMAGATLKTECAFFLVLL